MQYCSHCHVKVRGEKEKCPLCGNGLPNNGDTEKQQLFPHIPPSYERHLAIRIMVFISIAAVVASFAAYIIFPIDVRWPLFILFGLASMWISLIVILSKRHNIPKTILWHVVIVTLLSVFWDWQTGWRGWSLDYVIPIIYVAAMVVMYVTAKIMKLSIRDYITYAFLDGLFGIIPIAFLLLKWTNVLYPSIICIGASVIFLAAIFIFQGDNIRSELDKRMHT